MNRAYYTTQSGPPALQECIKHLIQLLWFTEHEYQTTFTMKSDSN